MCKPEDFKHLQIVNGNDNTTQWKSYFEDEFAEWHMVYLPFWGDLTGEIVYDFGAGCGETAQLFFNHGAAKVVCIECDPTALHYLKLNFGNDPRVQINPDRVGWIKMDIEGAEYNTRFEAHDAAPKIKVYRKWDRESNTGLYGLEKSNLQSRLQDPLGSSGKQLHIARVKIAHAGRQTLRRIGV